MSDANDYKIRRVTEADESFLFEMLFQSLFIEEGQEPYSREVLKKPDIARYAENWGRKGDMGFIAETDKKVGAVWCRLSSGENKGFGYLDDETPEMGIALFPEFRGRGVGTVLMKQFLEVASQNYPAICLSVSPNNPAIRLYERFGFETVDVRNNYPVMRLKFRNFSL